MQNAAAKTRTIRTANLALFTVHLPRQLRLAEVWVYPAVFLRPAFSLPVFVRRVFSPPFSFPFPSELSFPFHEVRVRRYHAGGRNRLCRRSGFSERLRRRSADRDCK